MRSKIHYFFNDLTRQNKLTYRKSYRLYGSFEISNNRTNRQNGKLLGDSLKVQENLEEQSTLSITIFTILGTISQTHFFVYYLLCMLPNRLPNMVRLGFLPSLHLTSMQHKSMRTVQKRSYLRVYTYILCNLGTESYRLVYGWIS